MNERRLALLNPDLVARVDRDAESRTLRVTETGQDGHADLRVHVPAGRATLALRLSGDGFPILRDQQNADGHLLVEDADGAWTAHVLECKKTIGERSWDKACAQIAASMARLQMLADFLGVRIDGWRAWVFREEKLSEAKSTKPASPRVPIGGRPPRGSALETWRSGRLSTALMEDVPVGRLRLDATGHGEHTLP